jgi:hypothetical protein
MLSPVSSLGREVHVEWLDCHSDGTIMAALVDSQGRKTHVCVDGWQHSPTRFRLFEQARHPNQQGAVLVELGSPEEGVLVPLLSRYCDSPFKPWNPKTDAPREETQLLKQLLKEALLRLGEPMIDRLELTDKQSSRTLIAEKSRKDSGIFPDLKNILTRFFCVSFFWRS